MNLSSISHGSVGSEMNYLISKKNRDPKVTENHDAVITDNHEVLKLI